MKYLFYTVISLVVVAVVYFGFFNRTKIPPSSDEQPIQPRQIGETKIDEQLPPTIKVTPFEVNQGADLWKFAIALDTHSGTLDQDLMKVIVLSDDKGGIYQPIAWQGAGPGGHHREGVVLFKSITPTPTTIRLKFFNLGGVGVRTFVWPMPK